MVATYMMPPRNKRHESIPCSHTAAALYAALARKLEREKKLSYSTDVLSIKEDDIEVPSSVSDNISEDADDTQPDDMQDTISREMLDMATETADSVPTLDVPVVYTGSQLAQTVDDLNREQKLYRQSLNGELLRHGLRQSDPRLTSVFEFLDADANPVTVDDLEDLCFHNELVERCLKGRLVIKDFEEFTSRIGELYKEILPNSDGKVADYIPTLASVNPDLFGVALCTVDGQRCGFGDYQVPFSVQSCSKVVTYCMAQTKLGVETVHKYIGKEPSGQVFNKLVLDSNDKPHNPFINAGAIMAVALVNPIEEPSKTFDDALSIWYDMCGFSRRRYRNGTANLTSGETPPQFNNATYLSEKGTSYRNTCLTYMMKEAKSFPDWVNNARDISKVIEGYLQFCSIECTADAMSMLAATLANGGTCPTTLKTVFQPEVVRNALSLMTTCGMYDASGQFAFQIGFPCKSGVGGGLLIVIPGVMGFCTFSPRLDSCGNSVRGVAFCKEMVDRYSVHRFESRNKAPLRRLQTHAQQPASWEDEMTQMLWAAYRGDEKFVKQIIAKGAPVNYSDYDGRTALHLAASEGHLPMVKLLVAAGAKVKNMAKDRYHSTPLMDAHREGRSDVVAYFEALQENNITDTDTPVMGNKLATSVGPLFTATLKPGYVVDTMWDSGLTINDPRLKPHLQTIRSIQKGEEVPQTQLDAFYRTAIVAKTIRGELRIPGWLVWCKDIAEFFDYATKKALEHEGDHPSEYMEILREIDPSLAGLCVVSVDGQVLSLGDTDAKFTAQACMNPIMYGLALETRGSDEVHKHVGFEPSGQLFDALILDERPNATGRPAMPHNAMIASGAIRVCALVANGRTSTAAATDALKTFEHLAGGRKCSFNEVSILEEAKMGVRNKCLMYMMCDSGNLTDADQPMEALRLYYQMCSLELDVETLGVIAGSLANGGVCPLTGETVLSPVVVKQVLSVMSACGLYDLSGNFAFEFGFPCKAAISGATIMVIPGVCGIAMYSPKLGKHRMSTAAFLFSQRLTARYRVHNLLSQTHTVGSCVGATDLRDPCEYRGTQNEQICNNLVRAAATGDIPGIRRLFRRGLIHSHMADYDGRTPLHLCCAEGHLTLLKYLLHKNSNLPLTPRDRWGHTPLMEAQLKGHTEVAELLESAIIAREGPDGGIWP